MDSAVCSTKSRSPVSNGSGKHNNWSLATDTGILLHGPGKTPTDNLRFVTFIVETLMAVYRHNGLLKAP